jgi:GxxExxY protein
MVDHEKHEKILFKEECYAIQGAVFEVYRQMGCDFLEAVCQESMERELQNRSIPSVAQQELKLTHKGALLSHTYKPDMICYESTFLKPRNSLCALL